jgi:outer membrane protein assembly factor BamA
MKRKRRTKVCLLLTMSMLGAAGAARGQQEPTTREQAIEQEQGEKAQKLTPQQPSKGEALVARLQEAISGQHLKWYPYFESAYNGGGFTLGLGYAQFVSPYSTIDLRGSYSIADYKRVETEFVSPRLFKRRAKLSVLGGRREATQVGFFGLGTDNTSVDDRVNYSFRQPYLTTTLTVKPTRRYMTLIGAVEYTQWEQRPGEGPHPSVETAYTPAELPGLGAKTKYLHIQGTFGFDWRTTPGYSRRGGFYGVTAHDYNDSDDRYGFRQIDYEAIQHLPILREAWVLSFRGLARTTITKTGEEIPFFMLPAIGGGSTMRGFSSWRFRDRNSLLLQGEWRIMVNRFLDTAFFVDAGKVTASTRDLDFNGLKTDGGFGVRFHGPLATPLRVEVAKGNEGLQVIFATGAAF